ncbi:unnamed protein product [Angiostrongylus costaricensis]|uniref:Uncharacterized protein n=1 Tax=Angiostrongylus costaricensis TaxID=334426 RepID=A0A158PEJ1_ANGCS|nr:unnamed protein product [Angiostrongylus costaricensis]
MYEEQKTGTGNKNGSKFVTIGAVLTFRKLRNSFLVCLIKSGLLDRVPAVGQQIAGLAALGSLMNMMIFMVLLQLIAIALAQTGFFKARMTGTVHSHTTPIISTPDLLMRGGKRIPLGTVRNFL